LISDVEEAHYPQIEVRVDHRSVSSIKKQRVYANSGHEESEKCMTKVPTDQMATKLVDLVLDRYQAEMQQTPRRVVVHNTSRYWPAERIGFRDALSKRVTQFDLVALSPQSEVRLLPANQYPALRGTCFRVGDLDYLYTTGYIAELEQYLSGHVPTPLLIADHVGHDTPRDTLLREILILTKMNWNSAHLGGLRPITLEFSRLVGDIMREIPPDREPLTNFKFYM